MKTPIRFENAINKLYTAFHNDTLEKGNCRACAVGNMCDNQFDWKMVFVTDAKSGIQAQNPGHYINDYISKDGLLYEPKKVIEKTGYSWEELARVEKAFESNTRYYKRLYALGDNLYSDTKTGNTINPGTSTEFTETLKEDQFRGLSAVIDVLCDIEGIENVMDFKSLFDRTQNHAELIKDLLV